MSWTIIDGVFETPSAAVDAIYGRDSCRVVITDKTITRFGIAHPVIALFVRAITTMGGCTGPLAVTRTKDHSRTSSVGHDVTAHRSTLCASFALDGFTGPAHSFEIDLDRHAAVEVDELA